MCTDIHFVGLNTREVNERIEKSLYGSSINTTWRFNCHAYSWHDAHCVYSCPFCKSFSMAIKDAHVRSRKMNRHGDYHGFDSCCCKDYETVVPKKVRVTIIKDHSNLDVFMQENAAQGIISAWTAGYTTFISFDNYDSSKNYLVKSSSISSISVEK